MFGWANGEDAKAAAALIVEALRLQRDAGDDGGMGHSLAFLGLIVCERGDAAAAGYVEESLNARLAMGALQYLPWSLENIALAAPVTRRWPEAARFFGVATSLRERFGSPGHEPEQSAYLSAIERARVGRGGAGFAAKWDAGQALWIDGCVAEGQRCWQRCGPVWCPMRVNWATDRSLPL